MTNYLGTSGRKCFVSRDSEDPHKFRAVIWDVSHFPQARMLEFVDCSQFNEAYGLAKKHNVEEFVFADSLKIHEFFPNNTGITHKGENKSLDEVLLELNLTPANFVNEMMRKFVKEGYSFNGNDIESDLTL